MVINLPFPSPLSLQVPGLGCVAEHPSLEPGMLQGKEFLIPRRGKTTDTQRKSFSKAWK